MLLTFSVANFRSISDEQILSMVGTALRGPHDPIDVTFPGSARGVLPCAVIYGPNASGKSNLLDAFVRMRSMIFRPISESSKGSRLKHTTFLLAKRYSDIPTSFEVSFLASGVRYDYGFSFNSSEIKEEYLFSYPEGRRRRLFEREGMDISFGGAFKGERKSLTKFLREETLLISVASQAKNEDASIVTEFFSDVFALNSISVHASVIDSAFSQKAVDPRVIRFLELIGTGVCDHKVSEKDLSEEQIAIREKVVEFLNAIRPIESDAEEQETLKINDKEYNVELGHRSDEDKVIFMPGEFESAGTRRLVLMMNYIFSCLDNGHVAVIDEIDASLHTYVVSSIIGLFTDPRINKKGAQLIATTHDTNSLDQNTLRRDEIWFAEKNRHGVSEYFSLAEIKSRKGESFEKAYLEGRYGAVPPKGLIEDLPI